MRRRALKEILRLYRTNLKVIIRSNVSLRLSLKIESTPQIDSNHRETCHRCGWVSERGHRDRSQNTAKPWRNHQCTQNRYGHSSSGRKRRQPGRRRWFEAMSGRVHFSFTNKLKRQSYPAHNLPCLKFPHHVQSVYPLKMPILCSSWEFSVRLHHYHDHDHYQHTWLHWPIIITDMCAGNDGNATARIVLLC